MKKNKLVMLACLVIFSLPAYLVRFSFLGLPTNAWEVLVVLLFFAWFFFAWKVDCVAGFFQARKEVVFWSGLVFLGLVSSNLVNGGSLVGWGIIKSWFFFPLLFWFLLEQLVSKEKRWLLFQSLAFSAFLVALFSLGGYFFGQVTYDGRLAGIFNSPNYLAMYLLPGIVIVLVEFIWDKKRGFFWYFCGLLVLLGALYLTHSYAAWLVLFVVSLVGSGAAFGEARRLGLGLFLVGLLFLAVFSQRDNPKFHDLVTLNERSSLSSRLMIWGVAQKLINENWMWGIGAGNFQEAYLAEQKNFPLFLEWAVPHPHNLYGAFWLSGGLLAFLSFLGLVFSWFRACLGKENTGQIYWAGLGIMLCILLGGLADTTYFKNDLAVIFWLLFCLGRN